MIWVYILSPILGTLICVMFGVPLLFPVKKLSPEVQAELDREEREDGELAIVKRKFINDEISMLELEQETEQILNGTWSNRPSPYGTTAEITTRGALTYMPPPKHPPPKPEDAARHVRTYSFPAPPGYPDTDPPIECNICGKLEAYDIRRGPYCTKCWKMQTDKQKNMLLGLPARMSSDGHTICTKRLGYECACPDCMQHFTIHEKRMAAGF